MTRRIVGTGRGINVGSGRIVGTGRGINVGSGRIVGTGRGINVGTGRDLSLQSRFPEEMVGQGSGPEMRNQIKYFFTKKYSLIISLK